MNFRGFDKYLDCRESMLREEMDEGRCYLERAPIAWKEILVKSIVVFVETYRN